MRNTTATSILGIMLMLAAGGVFAQDVNLARGKPCKVFSSLETSNWGTVRLTDGQTGDDGWSSRAFATHADHCLYPEWATVDLGANCAIQRVVLHATDKGQGFPEDFSIQVCREGEPWRVVVERRGQQRQAEAQTFDLRQTEGRFVKVEATRLREAESGEFRFQLAELEVWGQPQPAECLTAASAVPQGVTRARRLRCENRDNPMGMDEQNPRLSWWVESPARGQKQTAYQILVASTAEKLAADTGDLWDSGRVSSDQSVAVRYAGRSLEAGRPYAWKVMLWDKEGQPMPWSEPATFVTGKLRAEDWHGKWIGASVPRAARGVLGFAVEGAAAAGAKWVQVDLGEPRPIECVVLHPMHHEDQAAGGWIKGYGFPLRFRLELSTSPDFPQPVTVLADHTPADFPNPGWAPVAFDAAGKTARYVRLTVTKNWQRGPKLPFVHTLGELEAFCGGKNVALGAPVSANASVEGYGWGKAQLTDGKALAPATPSPDAPPVVTRKNPHGAIYLQKRVTVVKPVKRATAFFCGLGWSELAVDGRRVDEVLMAPGFTTYDKRTQYRVLDVTDQLSAGVHTLGVTLFDGWYALERDPWGHGFHHKPYIDEPKLLLDLHLEHADGTETLITSDESWQWSEGPITRSWLCEAEEDRRIVPGDDGWKPVAVVAGPVGRLVVQQEPPTRVQETLRPISLENRDGTWVYTFDREFTGFFRFRTSGPRGTAIRLATRSIRENAPGIPARNFACVLRGEGEEEFAPRQTYTAIARVYVSGVERPPALDDLVGCRVSGVGAVSGGSRCSNDLVNWLHEAVRRTQANYVTYLPNDPSREFKAWMEDPVNMFRSAVYLFDSQTMYERWQWDMLDGQTADGNLPNIAPGPGFDAYNSPWWGGSAIWLPWYWNLYYGDDSLLEESYPAMKRYVDFLQTQSTDGLQDWGLTDWLPVEETPRPIINTPAAYLYARIVSRTAERVGQTDDARHYAELAESIRTAFNRRFLDSSSGIYGSPGWKPQFGNWSPPKPLKQLHETWWTGDRPCTQGGQALAIMLGLVPDDVRAKADEAILREIQAHGNRLSTGFVSTPYLLEWLADRAPQVGWELTTAQEFPSWYAMTAGSDSDQMMETWNGGQACMPSLGGNLAAWHVESLAGIRPDPQGPGFKRFITTWATATPRSPRGTPRENGPSSSVPWPTTTAT